VTNAVRRFFAVALLFVIALKSTLHPAAAADRAIRITVAGDSLALGIGASDSSQGFAFDLFRRIRAQRPGSEVTNLAIGGTTASDVSRLEVPRIAVTRPDLVLLEVGANDAVRRRSARAFAADYATLVRAVRAAAPQAQVVLFNVPDVAISPIFDDASKPKLRRLVESYNVAVGSAAHGARLTVVDLFHISEHARRNIDRFFSADLFHPSDAGHAAIAAAAWPAVDGVLKAI
jgi:lysophospholipase L1-like esterase